MALISLIAIALAASSSSAISSTPAACCKDPSIMLAYNYNTGKHRDDLCANACRNNVACAGYSNNAAGCFSCDFQGSAWNDQTCILMQENKGCTEHGKCLLCPQDKPGHAEARNTIDNNKFGDLDIYTGESCHHYVDHSQHSEEEIRPIITTETLFLKAHRSVSLQGFAKFYQIHIEAPTVHVEGIDIMQPVYIKSDRVNIQTVRMLTSNSPVIFHNSENIVAEINNIISGYGPAIGSIGCDGGTINMAGCAGYANSNQIDSFVLIQDSESLSSPSVDIVQTNGCEDFLIVNATHEFELFSKEYEVKYFNKGLYIAHEGVNLQTVVAITVIIAILLVFLPLLHQSIWNAMYALLIKRHDSQVHL